MIFIAIFIIIAIILLLYAFHKSIQKRRTLFDNAVEAANVSIFLRDVKELRKNIEIMDNNRVHSQDVAKIAYFMGVADTMEKEG